MQQGRPELFQLNRRGFRGRLGFFRGSSSGTFCSDRDAERFDKNGPEPPEKKRPRQATDGRVAEDQIEGPPCGDSRRKGQEKTNRTAE